MSAFDELNRQLVQSVAARSRLGRLTAAGGLGRWWRSRVGGGALAVAIPLLFVTVLAAATLVARLGPRPVPPPRSYATIERPLERNCTPCRAVGGRLHAPLSGEVPLGGAVPVGPGREVRIRRGRPIVRMAPSEELPQQSVSTLRS